MAANYNHMNCLRYVIGNFKTINNAMFVNCYIFAQVFMTNDNFDNGTLAIHATTADE